MVGEGVGGGEFAGFAAAEVEERKGADGEGAEGEGGDDDAGGGAGAEFIGGGCGNFGYGGGGVGGAVDGRYGDELLGKVILEDGLGNVEGGAFVVDD